MFEVDGGTDAEIDEANGRGDGEIQGQDAEKTQRPASSQGFSHRVRRSGIVVRAGRVCRTDARSGFGDGVTGSMHSVPSIGVAGRLLQA